MKLKSAEANGWPVIEKYLKLRQRPQSELARELELTPSAITQMKSGRWLLNAGQLARLCDFLAIADSDLEQLYTQVVNARLPGLNLRVLPAARHRYKRGC